MIVFSENNLIKLFKRLEIPRHLVGKDKKGNQVTIDRIQTMLDTFRNGEEEKRNWEKIISKNLYRVTAKQLDMKYGSREEV